MTHKTVPAAKPNQPLSEAVPAHVYGVEFWYITPPDVKQWMYALLQGLQQADPFAVSKGDQDKLRSFFRAMDTDMPIGSETAAVTSGGLSSRLQLQYVRVKDLHIVLVQNLSRGEDTPQRDPVTGAYTADAFTARLETLLPKDGAIVLLRINHLDDVNDAEGRSAGDHILQEQARTLRVLLQEGELLGRSHGALFLLYLKKSSREVLEERLRIICAVLPRSTAHGINISVHLGATVLGGKEFHSKTAIDQVTLALRSLRWKEESDFAIYTPAMKDIRSFAPEPPTQTSVPDSRIFVRTFGYFDVFVDGDPIHFHGPQAKELMALLVDRRGGYLSSHEAIAALWENEPANKTTLARLRKVAMRLKNSLEDAGIPEIIQFDGSDRRAVPDKFYCDYYEFLDKGGSVFPGAYMTNYSWAETTLANLTMENIEYDI